MYNLTLSPVRTQGVVLKPYTGRLYKLTLPCGQKSYMTSQAINRREGVSKSCCRRSPKLCTFTQKELETARAAQELLGAPTIGGGSDQPGGSGGGSQRRQINLPSRPEYTKTGSIRPISLTFCPNNCRKHLFFT